MSVWAFSYILTFQLSRKGEVPHFAIETMAVLGENYGSFQLKVPQTLIVGTSFSDSGNVKRW